MSGPLVAGVDSSTQSCKVVVVDAETGAIVDEARRPHPDGSEVDPQHWVSALDAALGELDGGTGFEAIAVGGQQHGMVLTDADGAAVRPALLWNDTRSAAAADELTAEFGGDAPWAAAVGSALVPSLTVTKLRWVADHEPDVLARAAGVRLPHDHLTAHLAADGAVVTDRGDASGTGYWSPITGEYRHDLLEAAARRTLAVPPVAGPADRVGTTATGAAIGPGTGDNMAAALGLALRPGEVVVSLGTSGTAFAVADRPVTDRSGAINGFADATGRFLPLVCTLNAARVLDSTARLLGISVERLGDLALEAEPGSGGLTLLPYFDGERVPNLPRATGSLLGITRTNYTAANLARAAIEGILSGLADGIRRLADHGVEPERIVLIGGAARSSAVQQVAAAVFDRPIEVPATAEYVALGAARQAAWVLTGELPAWERRVEAELEPDVATAHALLRQHLVARAQVHDHG